MEPLARLPVFFALDGKRARGRGRHGRRRPGRPSCSRRPAQTSTCLRTTPSDEMLALAAEPPGGAIVLHLRALDSERISPAPRIAVGAFDDDREAAALRSGGARGRRPRQRDRQAGVLRFLLRLDRQPLAAGDRHFDRRRRAGFRARRSARKIEALIPRGFARWAEAARRWRDGVQASGLSFAGAAPLLAVVHRARGRAIPIASPRERDFDALHGAAAARRAAANAVPSRWSAPARAIPSC